MTQITLALQSLLLAGLATARPTTERILTAFKFLSLTIFSVRGEEYGHVSPLNPLQQKILQLLGLPSDIYSSLEASPV